MLAAGVALLAAGLYDSAPPPLTHAATPGSPSFHQLIADCRIPAGQPPIQAPPGCDDRDIHRFERPFESGGQMRYIPDLDILSAEMGRVGDWFFLRISLAGLQQGRTYPTGVYALEIDGDLDGRGELLVMAAAPGKSGGASWSVAGVQVRRDAGGDGYERLIFDSGRGSDPDLAWSRFNSGSGAVVELAFHWSILADETSFKWWVWAAAEWDAGRMDFNGAAVSSASRLPLDNTCKGYWPGLDDGDPLLCLHDAFIPVAGSLPSSTPAGPSASPTAAPARVTPSASPTMTPSPSPTLTLLPAPSLAPTQTSAPTATRRPILPSPTPTSPPPTPVPTETDRNCDPVEGCG